MIEATDYLSLTLLILIQYLGFQHGPFEIQAEFTKSENYEQRRAITAELTQKKDGENQWILMSPEIEQSVQLTIVKDNIAFSENGKIKTVIFDDVNFERLKTQQDTIFNHKEKALVTISRENKTVEFKILDNWAYEQITFKVKE